MAQHAKVDSITALRDFRARLVIFEEAAALALEEMKSELQQTLMWLREDQYKHWHKQVRLCTDEHTQARLALKRKQIFDRAVSGSVSSCVDERKALKKAEQRLQEAEFRYKRIVQSIQQIEKAQADYKGLIKGLTGDLAVSLPNARSRLDKMVMALEKYVALLPPELRETAINREDAPRLEWETTTRSPEESVEDNQGDDECLL